MNKMCIYAGEQHNEVATLLCSVDERFFFCGEEGEGCEVAPGRVRRQSRLVFLARKLLFHKLKPHLITRSVRLGIRHKIFGFIELNGTWEVCLLPLIN